MIDLKRQIVDLLPSLRTHLQCSLAPQIKNRYPVEDIVQETFLRALQKLDTLDYRNSSAMLGWLQTIAHRLVIDRIRKRDPQLINDSDANLAKHLAERSSELTPSGQVSTEETRLLLTLAMTKLSEHHRHVLHLRYVDGLTFAEIATTMGTHVAAARGLHKAAMKRLQRELGRASLYFPS
jgi:RNA polymerase sigma-70 factor (ECF subfamily)